MSRIAFSSTFPIIIILLHMIYKNTHR